MVVIGNITGNVVMGNITGNVSGALSYVTCRGISPDFNYLEACFRAYIDGSDTPQFLSSGVLPERHGREGASCCMARC